MYVYKLLDYLENVSCFKCWAFIRNHIGGHDYSVEIENAIKSCSCFVLLYSDSARQSKDVMKEFELAELYGKTTILCKVDTSELEGLFMYHCLENVWYNIVDCSKEELKDMAVTVGEIIEVHLRQQAKQVKRRIERINVRITRILIRTFVKEGKDLIKLYNSESESLKEKYITLTRFNQPFASFCKEVKRIKRECESDYVNNSDKLDILLNRMLKALKRF